MIKSNDAPFLEKRHLGPSAVGIRWGGNHHRHKGVMDSSKISSTHTHAYIVRMDLVLVLAERMLSCRNRCLCCDRPDLTQSSFERNCSLPNMAKSYRGDRFLFGLGRQKVTHPSDISVWEAGLNTRGSHQGWIATGETHEGLRVKRQGGQNCSTTEGKHWQTSPRTYCEKSIAWASSEHCWQYTKNILRTTQTASATPTAFRSDSCSSIERAAWILLSQFWDLS